MPLQFLSELLLEYGIPLAHYAGTGTLSNEIENTEVVWTAAQYPDGRVLLACQSNSPTFGIFFSGATQFSGSNAAGVSFSWGRGISDLPFLKELPEDFEGWWAVYHLSMLHADFPISGPPTKVRYRLTNFEFDSRTAKTAIAVTLPGVEGVITINPDPSDSFASDRLRTLRRPTPTAWLEIDPQGGQAAAARQIANNVCNLLSVARGTKVNWISEELVADAGTTHLVHSNRITKPFSPFAPLDPIRIGGIREFLEQTYETYVENRDLYKLDRGTIDAFLDAKIETDYLETRGVKLAVALETLKQNVLIRADPMAEHHVEPSVFAGTLKQLSDASFDILTRAGVAKPEAMAIAAKERFLALNRRSFSSLVRKVAKTIGLKLSSKDLELFVRCRNSLVHQGAFYTATATPDDRESVPPKASKFEEYLFMLGVSDAFLLRVIGYSGRYAVRTKADDWQVKVL